MKYKNEILTQLVMLTWEAGIYTHVMYTIQYFTTMLFMCHASHVITISTFSGNGSGYLRDVFEHSCWLCNVREQIRRDQVDKSV